MSKTAIPQPVAAPVATARGSIGSRLKLLRERRNLSQVELSAALNVSRPTVSEWESGIKQPGRENLKGLAMFFRCDLGWLIEGGAEPITAENPDEERLLRALRDAPDNIRNAVAALLQPYADPPPQQAQRS